MKNWLHIVLFGLISTALSAQETELFFDVAQKLPDAVNSDDAEEAGVMLSPAGDQLYFVRTFFAENEGGEEAGHDIWMSKKTGDSWSTATNDLGPLNTKDDDAIIGISADGKRAYLMNTYQKEKKRVTGIAVCDIKEGKYSKPKYYEIPSVEYDGDFYGFYMTPEENIIIISTEGYESEGEEDLYVSFKNGDEWSVPVWMGETINSEGYEIAPFLSADGKRLFFSSNGFGGWGGADIYESTRLDDSWTNWSKPRNLGRNINSRGFDAYISVTPGGDVYFTSNRGDAGDIYKSRILKDDEYYIDESGIVHYTQREMQQKLEEQKSAQDKIDQKFQESLKKEREEAAAQAKAEEEARKKAAEEAEARAEKDKAAAEKKQKKQQEDAATKAAAEQEEMERKAMEAAAKKQEEEARKAEEAKKNTTLEGAPAKKPAETATAPAKKKKKGQVLSFAPNAAFLTPESGIQMDNAAFFMMDTEELVMRIYVESDSKNEKLNMERAEEAKYYLQGKGIAAERIQIDGPHKAPQTSIEIFFEF